jgi:glycosyltransferase involved in cell wall biosynthesis
LEATLASQSEHPNISIVIPALNEGAYLRRTVELLTATLPPESEIVVVDNGSIDGGADFLDQAQEQCRLIRTPRLGAASARNWGAWHSTGDLIVFADAHVEVSHGWWLPLIEALRQPQVGAVAPVISALGNPDQRGYGYRWRGPDLDMSVEWLGSQGAAPYPVPFLSSCFLAIRRDTFTSIGGFDSGLLRWGSEDSELSLRLWLLGYEQLIVPQVQVAHLFRTKQPYEVEWVDVLHNMLRMAFAHFSTDRLAIFIYEI